jgi:molybdopterin converting factor small subunit
MGQQGSGSVRVIVFGPLIELLGSRNHKVALTHNMSIEDIVYALGAESWLEKGITVALNGEQCPLDIHPSNGDEVALLPPVSGG